MVENQEKQAKNKQKRSQKRQRLVQRRAYVQSRPGTPPNAESPSRGLGVMYKNIFNDPRLSGGSLQGAENAGIHAESIISQKSLCIGKHNDPNVPGTPLPFYPARLTVLYCGKIIVSRETL